MRKVLKKFSAWLLVVSMVLGLMPGTVRTVKAADTKKNVVVSVEGQTLSHGFYIEPTIVSFDEFIDYWAEKGQTVAADNITAGGMIDYVLAQNGLTYNKGTTGLLQGPGYLAGIEGIKAGYPDAVVPECLADAEITIRQVAGDDLYEKEYTGQAGWMFTDGDWMGDQAMGGHYFSQVGRPYTYNGETYYVIRLQHTIAGLGADLGHNEWGTSYGYTAADKSNLYILYANLDKAGILDKIPDTKEDVLAVINQLDASQTAVDEVYEELLGASQAEEPVFEDNLPKGALTYEVGDEADTLKVKATVNRGTLTYEWFKSTDKKNWTSLGESGEDNNRYVPETDEVGTSYYKCVVTNNDEATGLTSTVESNIATVVCGISTPVFETDLDEAEKTYLVTDTASPLEVAANVSGDTVLSYQWYQSTDKENWSAIAGADKASYTPDVSKIGTIYYKCTATNTKGTSQKSADSNIATVTVKVDQPVFDTNLRTTTYYPNYDEECILTVAASVKDGGEITYQWYATSSPSETDLSKMTLIEGATGTSYTVDTSKPMESYYKVVATNTVQGKTAVALSNWSRVDVKTKTPYIEQDLEREVRYLVGEKNPETLKIEASVEDDGELSYQWYESTDEEKPWDILEMTPIEGATGTSYTPDTSKGYTAYYACRVTNTNRGQSKYEDSRICTVIISCQQPVITKDLPDSVSYLAGAENVAPFEIEASVEDGGTLSYQWYQKEGSAWTIDVMEAIEGATGASYTPDITKADMRYACRVTNTKDGYTSFIDSNIVKAEVTCDAPEITQNPDTQIVVYDKGAKAEALSVEATVNDGGVLSYQWYCGESENAMSPIEGATEVSYTPSTEAAGTLCYKVVVTNTKAGITNSTDSAIAKIKVLAPQEEISTEEELRAITENGNYILTADIELTSPWKQMKKFSGILDGDGHVIRGVVIEDSDSDGVAFFHTTGIGAEIKNLGLEGKVTQTSWGTAASFVGITKGDGLTISNCYANVEVNGNEWANVGGLVGKVDHSAVIENSYFVGTLSGGTGSSYAAAGGLAGQTYNSDVVIRNCYTTHDKAVGSYAKYNEAETKNNYCASETDEHAAKIPEDMDTFLTALNEGNDAFVADSNAMNHGYPILAWQYEPAPFPGTEEAYWGVKTEAKVYDDFQNDIWMQYQQKDMKVGDKASLRPWRVEQIVTNTITNDVARPTFHFEIVAGDSVSLDTESSDSKAIVTAVKPGTTVVKVTYDAMDYKEQRWDAISDVNTGYVVYTVGEKGTAEIDCSKELKEWRHYDTIYYHEGETVPYTFDVSADGAESVRVTLNGETVEGTDGKYTVHLENRSNIIGIETKDANGNIKSLYRVMDARFVEVNVENKTNPGEKLQEGDTANVSLHGITMPVYKLATIYNPTMNGWGAKSTNIQYENEKLGSFEGHCKQWDLATNNDFDVTFEEAGSYTFDSPNGIYCEWWGKELGADLTAEGSGEPGLGVPAYKGNFSKLPSFTVDVAEKEAEKPPVDPEEPPVDPEEPPVEPEIPESITLVHEKYGLQLTGKGLTSDMEFVVARLDIESDAVKAIRNAISSSKGVFALYDVKLMQNGKEIALPEEANLSIPVGTKYNGMTMPVLLYTDGKVKELSGTVKEGYMEVTVKELGGFGVVVDMNDPVDGNDTNGNNTNGNQGTSGAGNSQPVKTGDATSMLYVMCLLTAGSAIVILSMRRRKKEWN